MSNAEQVRVPEVRGGTSNLNPNLFYKFEPRTSFKPETWNPNPNLKVLNPANLEPLNTYMKLFRIF
jgi:hypothetical protein